ncbi:helix-turn-helix transcriptional regulator [Candidatus Tisiphia endosymbiont of Beris chalybata]|uniref:helix-turn-helix transcriptional regulator n=1 Tax=Candidatus Tisiphia endosymbiont of Beris chalybata TaxID=3066262 RepID=UPI00312C9EDA
MIYDDLFSKELLQAIDRFIALRIRALRFYHKCSRAQLTQMINISIIDLEKYESATKTIPVEILKLIAEALIGGKIDYFYKGLNAVITLPPLNSKISNDT